MHLNDIVEKSTTREITLRTMISEENVEYLVEMQFDKLKKVKTLGFISILEREYELDLSEMRAEALAYYENHLEGPNYYVNKPIDTEEGRSKSKFFIFLLVAGLIYASWYFFTQFDKKHLHELIPFIGEDTFETFINDKNTTEETSISALSISSVNEVNKDEIKTEEASVEMNSSATTVEIAKVDSNTSTDTLKEDANISVEAVAIGDKQIVSILPSSRLWFGVIDRESKKRDHFSIAQPYKLDVTTQSWLVATSSASFELKQGEDTKAFSDAKEHYFKISKEEIEELSKKEYVSQGGWSQW